MAPDYACYIGPVGGEAGVIDSNGSHLVPLVPHETVVPVLRGEAEASENWEPVDAPATDEAPTEVRVKTTKAKAGDS